MTPSGRHFTSIWAAVLMIFLAMPAQAATLSAAGAHVTLLRFFESPPPPDVIPYGQRSYSDSFAQRSARYIWFELHVQHPASNTAQSIPITVRYLRSDGGLLTEGSLNMTTLANSTATPFASGAGWNDPGYWPLGTHTVQILDGNGEVAAGSFTVTDEQAALPEFTDSAWVSTFYVAYWGRAGDPDGRDYWTGQIRQGLLAAADVAENFALSQEAKDLYPYFMAPHAASQALKTDFVLEVYKNLLNLSLPGTDQGVRYWVGELDLGRTTPGKVIGNIIYAAMMENGANWQVIWNKTQVAEYYASRFKASGQPWNHRDQARSVMEGITSDPSTVDAAKVRIDQLLGGENFEIGPIQVTSIRIGAGDAVKEVSIPNTGLVFRFPAGGQGEIKTAAILSAPPSPFPGEGVYIEYDGMGEVQLVLPGVDDGSGAYPMVHVHRHVDGSFHDDLGSVPRWISLPYTSLSGGRMAFTLYPNEASGQRATHRQSALQRADHTSISHIQPGDTDGLALIFIKEQAQVYHDFFLNSVSPAKRDSIRAHMQAHPLHIALGTTNSYTGFWWLQGLRTKARPIVTVNKTHAQASLAHEIGHYYTHLLPGDASYYQLEKQAPILFGTRHAIGGYVGRDFLLEDYAHYFDFFLRGMADSFHLHNPRAFLDARAPNQDVPGLEGCGAFMLAALTNPETRLRDSSGEMVDVPVIGLAGSAVFEIIAQGALTTDDLRQNIHDALSAANKTAFQVHLQHIGWRYEVRGRFVDRSGTPVATRSGTRLGNFVEVNGKRYPGGWSLSGSSSDGRFSMRHVFGGPSILQATLSNGTAVEVPISIDWSKPTNVTVDLGDIVLDAQSGGPSTHTGIFPAPPFDGMQIAYTIGGVKLKAPRDGLGQVGCSREYQGRLEMNSQQLQVSGTITRNASSQYAGRLTVTINSGEVRSYVHDFPAGSTETSHSFDIAIPIPDGAAGATFKILLTMFYPSAHYNVIVNGEVRNCTVFPSWPGCQFP